MRTTTRVMLALATLGLGLAALSAGSLPGNAGRCSVPAAAEAGGAGCCYYNKGVCDCEGGRARCCDGKVSASCRCASDALITREITVRTQKPLKLADAAFASQEFPEPPSLRLKLFRLGADALRFWFRLDCEDECWSRLAVDGTLAVEVRWLFDPGGAPVPEDAPQTIALQRNRPSVFVARPVRQLREGHWQTEVRFDTDRLCVRDDDRSCWFPIEVQR